MQTHAQVGSTTLQIAEPPIARFLFADTRLAPLWAIIRIYLGYESVIGNYSFG